jgi:hypothetical protein
MAPSRRDPAQRAGSGAPRGNGVLEESVDVPGHRTLRCPGTSSVSGPGPPQSLRGQSPAPGLFRKNSLILRATGSGLDERRAALERDAARAILDELRARPVAIPLVQTEQDEARPGQPSESDNLFRCEGDYWSVTYDGQTVRVRDLKGMRYVARLLAEPGREYHVLSLVAAERVHGGPAAAGGAPGLPRWALGDAGEVIDA